jgi:hypothetical protein
MRRCAQDDDFCASLTKNTVNNLALLGAAASVDVVTRRQDSDPQFNHRYLWSESI